MSDTPVEHGEEKDLSDSYSHVPKSCEDCEFLNADTLLNEIDNCSDDGDNDFNEDDIIVDTEPLDNEELFEDDFFESLPENITSAISNSVAIDALPDISNATNKNATDSTCTVAVCHPDPTQPILLVAVGSLDESLRLYTYNIYSHSFNCIQTLTDFKDSVVSVEFSFDGKYLAAASYDSIVYIYSVIINPDNFLLENQSILTLLHRLEGPTLDIEWLKWHPKGYPLIAGSKDGSIWMWMGNTGTLMNIFLGHGAPVSCGTFVYGGKMLASGDANGTVIVWNPKTTERFCTFEGNDISQSKKTFESTSHRKKEGLHYHTEPVTCIASHPTLPIIATGSEDTTILMINVETRRVIGTLSSHTDSVETLEFYNHLGVDGLTPLLASGSLDGTIHIWDCNRLVSRGCFKHTDILISETSEIRENRLVGGITRLHWKYHTQTQSPLLISAATDSTLRIWDVRDYCCLHLLSGHTDTILDFNVIDVGKHYIIASCSDDMSVKIWNITEDKF